MSATKLVQNFLHRELANVVKLKGKNGPVQLGNPFLPFFNAKTQRWAPPKYSRRRQAELVKAARVVGVVDLLPLGPRMGRMDMEKWKAESAGKRVVEEPVERIDWQGEFKEKDVAGADIGARLYAGKKRMFKGHKWERMRKRRRAIIGLRLRDMDKRIHKFKSIYARRAPRPLSKPKVLAKDRKLPF